MFGEGQKVAGNVPRLQLISACVAVVEKRLAGLIGVVVFLLITANIICRLLRLPVFWIDELAIYAMIWMAFLAASAGIQGRDHIVVTLVADRLSAQAQKFLSYFVDLVMLVFGGILLVLAWVWFAPYDLIIAGGDVTEFSENTLNFIYSEPTSAIGLPKFLFWLIMPIFSFTICLHSLAHLLSVRIVNLPEKSKVSAFQKEGE
ncbi:TRAP transporter small permease [Kordiimonas pumila]|uniref:TRAP transporter small permease protein n=1 Tax=Kordiimonas pumila TaxID=2161677 RepID=A0ABV7DA87_9PROT|nr:TRAP transporter small permease [Kordiimonas pumila]